jgi:hypothetical protein
MWWVLLIITAVLTTLIVWLDSWIKRNKETHPDIYKNRMVIRGIIYLILNFGQF